MPSVVPPDASAAMVVACSGLIVGVVATVSPGKTRPRTPVTRWSSVLAGLPRPVKTRDASRTGTAPSAWVARVVVTLGTVSVSGSPSRSVVESTPNRAGPCSSMNAAGLPGQEPPESSARNPVTSSWRPTQPVWVSERSRSTASRSAPMRAAASPPAWWLRTQVSETTSVTGSRSSSMPSIGVWQPVTTSPSIGHREERPPAAGRPASAHARDGRVLIMATRWSGPRSARSQ